MQVSTKYIVLVVCVITLILLIVALFFLLYVRLYNQRKKKYFEEKQKMAEEFENQLLRSQIEVQEATLSTLSKELHDNVGQLLSTSRMILGMMERKMPSVPDELHTVQETLVKAIHEIRSLSKTLSKEWLEQFSFIENVSTEAERIKTAGLIQIEFDYSTVDLPLSSEQQIILFRIVQEAIQNVIKHAMAKFLLLEVRVEDAVRVVIKDDGIGFDPDDRYPGVGLLNIKRRVELLGRRVSWESQSQKGTTIVIVLPINKQ